MRIAVVAAAVVAVPVAAAALAATVGVPAGVTASLLRSAAQDGGVAVTIGGRTRLSPGGRLGVIAHDVTVADPATPGFALTVVRVAAELPWSGVLSGRPQIARLTLHKPALAVPLSRERRPERAARGAAERGGLSAPDEIVIEDGVATLSDAANGVERRIAAIGATIRNDAQQRLSASGAARIGEGAAKFSLTAQPAPGAATIPMTLTLEAPGLLPGALTARAELRRTGTAVAINGLSGTLGDGQFTGWAAVDGAARPTVKLDLDFQRLDWPLAAPAATSAAWSDAPFDVAGFNYVDAQVRISAAELHLGQARFAPAALEATLADGVLTLQATRLGVYGGKVDGALAADLSRAVPSMSMRLDLDGVQALPLLSGLAGFDTLDGRMHAKIVAQSRGGSPRTVVAGLSGSAFVSVQDGEIRGLNVAQMIRSLAAAPLAGWQDNPAQSTDLTELAASFKIERGEAKTSDLALAGPLVRMTGAGTVDLPAKSLAFRVEPKLVTTLQGQGGGAAPVGLGVPVAIEGSWSGPRIYPDVAGILDNPDAAYARLRQLGQGLFAGPGQGGGALGDTLGALIQQGLGAQQPTSRPGRSEGGEGRNPMDGILKQLFSR